MYLKKFLSGLIRPGSRSVNSSRNAIISLAVSFTGLLCSFLNRTVFIHYLNSEFLGLNGLFSNILGLLSLVEFGIGAAINYALYVPLRNGDIPKIRSLMAVYRRLYSVVCIAILGLGLVLVPFLQLFIREPPKSIPLNELRLYFVLHVLSTASSYLFASRRALIFCDQKDYISTLIAGLFRILSVCLQITILCLGGSYLFYIISHIAVGAAENLFIAWVAGRLYPFLREKRPAELSMDESRMIKKNSIAILFHKIGGMVVFSTDNMIISRFISLTAVGVYSNYVMLITATSSIINRIMGSMTASVGNLMAERDNIYTEKVFYHILFMNTWLYGFSSVCLFCLLQPFVSLWLGDNWLMSQSAVLFAVLSFYFNGIRQTLFLFKDAAGIFRQDRFKPLFEGLVNIAVSIPLAIRFGITGVLAGTVFSLLSVAIWYEGYTFFKERYHKSAVRYFVVQAGYFLLYTALAACCLWITAGMTVGGLPGLLLKLTVCILLPNTVCYILFRKTEHYAYFMAFARSLAYRVRKKRSNGTGRPKIP